MDEHDILVEHFEEHRTHLRAVAYRMLGSVSEADDAVQEVWLRHSRSDTSEVENLAGWLTTVVARVCLDMLRSRASRRELPLDEPLGTYVPDPIVSREDGIDPEHEARQQPQQRLKIVLYRSQSLARSGRPLRAGHISRSAPCFALARTFTLDLPPPRACF